MVQDLANVVADLVRLERLRDVVGNDVNGASGDLAAINRGSSGWLSEAALAIQLCTKTADGAGGDVEPYRDKIARPWLSIAIGYEIAGKGFSSREPERSRLISRGERLQRKPAAELGAAVTATEREYLKRGGGLTVIKRIDALL